MTDSRPLLALLANVQTPYRVHLHRRIAREIPQIRIASLYTHDQPDQPWERQNVAEINPVQFGRGQPVVEQSHARWMLADWRKGGRIARWLRENGAAVLILGGYNDLTRLRLIRACRATGLPCFLLGDSNIHGDGAAGLKRAIKDRLVRWVVRSTTGVMPCGSLGRLFFERYGARPERIYYVPYEPDYDLIRAVPAEATVAALARFGLNPSRKRLVVCARLVPVKRVDLAIDAFARIAAERPDWDLIVIGDGALKDQLVSRVPPALAGRVFWAGFIGDQSVISALYRGSHILVCPSDLEPWGVVINEAAAAGLAIVATSVVGAAAELVRDDVNGFSVPPHDLPALSLAVRRATDPNATERLRRGSAAVLDAWRREGDPVEGVRRALRAAGIAL